MRLRGRGTRENRKPDEDSSRGLIKHGRPNSGSDESVAWQCYQLALRFLGHRQRSEAEILRYLNSKNAFTDEEINNTIARLKNLKLVDDREFARSWRDDRLTFKPRSRAMIRRELVQKGLDAETINEAIAGIDDLESAFQVANRRASQLSKLEYPEFYRRLAGFLGRRGYSGEVISITVRKIWQTLQGNR